MVNVVTIAAYRRIYWLRLIGLVQRSAATWRCVLHSSYELGELSQWQCSIIIVVRYYQSVLLLLLLRVAQWSSGYWLAHLEFELGDPGSNPGSFHYSTGQVVYTHCLPSFSAPRN